MDNLDRFVKIARRFIHIGDVRTIIDIGACYGYESCRFRQYFPLATIHAFECNPAVLPKLKTRAHRADVRVIEKAVTHRNGLIPFYPINSSWTRTSHPDGNPGASSIYKASGRYPVETYVQDEILVTSTRLDSYMIENGLDHIDLLWMDVQGAELSVLMGMLEYLTSVLLIHTEVEFTEIYQGQPLFHEIKGYLNFYGFRLIAFTSWCGYFADAVFLNTARIGKLTRARSFVEDFILGAIANWRGVRA